MATVINEAANNDDDDNNKDRSYDLINLDYDENNDDDNIISKAPFYSQNSNNGEKIQK